jgi:hypothetical protein
MRKRVPKLLPMGRSVCKEPREVPKALKGPPKKWEACSLRRPEESAHEGTNYVLLDRDTGLMIY